MGQCANHWVVYLTPSLRTKTFLLPTIVCLHKRVMESGLETKAPASTQDFVIYLSPSSANCLRY